MVKVLYGPKGIGKTKKMIEMANEMAQKRNGDIVFIDSSKELMYDLKHEIRFTDISDYPVKDTDSLVGFICGIVSQDFDIESIFVDGISHIIGPNKDDGEQFIKGIDNLCSRNNISIIISLSGNDEAVPEYIRNYAEE